MLMIIAGLGEEIGWRGYASSEMRKTQGALKLSLIIGIIWGFWHIPTFFFTEGGFFSYSLAQEITIYPAIILYVVYIIVLAVLHGWVYFATDENLLMVVLLRAALNTGGWFLGFADLETVGILPMIIYILIMIGISIVVVKVYGSETLSLANKKSNSQIRKRIFYK